MTRTLICRQLLALAIVAALGSGLLAQETSKDAKKCDGDLTKTVSGIGCPGVDIKLNVKNVKELQGKVKKPLSLSRRHSVPFEHLQGRWIVHHRRCKL